MKEKPIYLLPCIAVYKFVKLVTKIPLMFFHYLLLGFFFTFYYIINVFVMLGIFISKLWYRFVKYFFMGVAFPFVFILRLLHKGDEKELKELQVMSQEVYHRDLSTLTKRELQQLDREKEKLEKIGQINQTENGRRLTEEERANAKTEQMIKQQQAIYEKHKKEQMDQEIEFERQQMMANARVDAEIEKDKAYLKKSKKAIKEENLKRNQELEEKRKNLNGQKKSTFGSIIAAIFGKKKEKEANDPFSDEAMRLSKKKAQLEREKLLIGMKMAEAKKKKKLVFEYIARDREGKIIKSYFEAFSDVEVHSFLLSEGYEVISIKTSPLIQLLHGSKEVSNVKVKTKDLLFFLTQLSTYIKAGIPLVESVRILSRQFKGRAYQKLFKAIMYDLTMGDNFSEALAKQRGAFPRILINMVKAAEMTGELPETLDDMYEYFSETDKTKKQMITAITYPTFVFAFSIVALAFIMVYIVPKFTEIYASMDDAELPGITIFIINLSDFLKNYWLWLIGGIAIFVIVFIYLFKNVKAFRKAMQYVAMHVPIIGNVIIYNEVTMFTKTFASLLRHNVFITDTMEILNKITGNEIWKAIILDTIANLSKGEKISTAFENHWAVPIPAYEMIVTGERTGQLPEMMQKVSDYYQELHKNSVGRIKSFVEPILILFLTGAVGLIVLSIIIPMFGMYDNLN